MNPDARLGFWGGSGSGLRLLRATSTTVRLRDPFSVASIDPSRLDSGSFGGVGGRRGVQRSLAWLFSPLPTSTLSPLGWSRSVGARRAADVYDSLFLLFLYFFEWTIMFLRKKMINLSQPMNCVRLRTDGRTNGRTDGGGGVS